MSTFQTERLPLAISIHAAGILPYLTCERIDSDKVAFIFDDVEGIGAEVELEYDNGALAVPANKIFASQKFLRRQMSVALGERENRSTSHGRAR